MSAVVVYVAVTVMLEEGIVSVVFCLLESARYCVSPLQPLNFLPPAGAAAVTTTLSPDLYVPSPDPELTVKLYTVAGADDQE